MKRKFRPENYIPNQSKYQEGIFNSVFLTELKGQSASDRNRANLIKRNKIKK